MALVFRDAHLSDLDRIIQLEDICFTDPWTLNMLQDDFANRWSNFRIAEQVDPLGEKNSILLGFYIYWHVVDEVNLIQVAVHPTYQKQGIGRQLIHDLIACGKRVDAHRIFLEVRRSNQAAIRLYESTAFEHFGIRKNYYTGPQEDALCMAYTYSTELHIRP